MSHTHTDASPLRLLFVKHTLAYPRAAGHDIRTFNMMRALTDLGHTVGLVTATPPRDAAIAGLQLSHRSILAEHSVSQAPPLQLSTLQARYSSYFGVASADSQAVGVAARDFGADVVVGVGADILPYLSSPLIRRRVWYAGDEWVSHYLSMWRATDASSYRNIREAAIWGVYQRAFVPLLSRIWVVSEREQRAMCRWAGTREVDALPNGVDTEYYRPQHDVEIDASAVFWGRLDFGPNIQALDWFCRNVWPEAHRRVPTATFEVIGFAPGAEVRALTSAPGIVLSPNVDDIRGAVGRRAVVVLPFNSGGGIKNKLLEAASMEKAIIGTPRACSGLRGTPAVVVGRSPQEWIDALVHLWTAADERRALGARARAWVLAEHDWTRTAGDAIRSLRDTP